MRRPARSPVSRRRREQFAIDAEDGDADLPGRILFWRCAPGRRPQDFVRGDVPREARRILGVVLASGREVACCRGSAHCRICGRPLGVRDLDALGLVWPELAEHYVLEHGVWTPGCSELLVRVAGVLGRRDDARSAA